MPHFCIMTDCIHAAGCARRAGFDGDGLRMAPKLPPTGSKALYYCYFDPFR